MSHIKKYIIKEATRKRCQIIPVSQEILKEFRSISLELYHLMYEADTIDFCVYIRISDEIVKFIKPNELSKELLAQVWNAIQKPNSDVEVCVRNRDIPRFQRLIDRIRKQKINQRSILCSKRIIKKGNSCQILCAQPSTLVSTFCLKIFGNNLQSLQMLTF